MIYDKDFLKRLDQQRDRVIYARITSLTLDEYPIETIEGRVTQGSINIDGSSAVRRTCNLSLVGASDLDYNWGLKTKFKLEIGLQNQIDSSYPSIIWFEQGIYYITSFSSSHSTSSFSIAISGKDKMCQLNGELGGKFNSSIDLGQYEEVDKNGDIRIIKYPIKQIIRDLVHQYGNEPFHKIIINDLDELGLELQEYMYDIPMYLFRRAKDESGNFFNGTLNGNQPCWIDGVQKTLGEIENYDSLSDDFAINLIEPTKVKLESTNTDDEAIYVAKIEFGQTAGYKEIDLVFPTEFICNIGDTVTSALDKIKNTFGDFEYFYNIDGDFVFQKKRTYLNSSWNPISSDGNSIYVETIAEANQFSYIFSGTDTFTTISNAPNISNIKNDFTVWGTRRSITGQELPMHMRYALDKRPEVYTSIEVTEDDLKAYNKKYGLSVAPQTPITYIASTNRYTDNGDVVECDWREIIFQMAKDYRKYNHLDDFESRVMAANPNTCPLGKTGYEQYYIDIEGFWRLELFNPQGDLEKFYSSDSVNYGWNKAVFERPESLAFWFDFLDTTGELAQYSVPTIGTRPHTENDSNVKAIYYNTPKIIFYDLSADDLYDNRGENTGYRYFNIGSSGFDSMFRKSSQGKSAKDAIDSMLYNYAYCSESITINSIPIYYLEPNTRIYINDMISGLEGEYILNKISLPLGYNGTMSMSAIKATNRLL